MDPWHSARLLQMAQVMFAIEDEELVELTAFSLKDDHMGVTLSSTRPSPSNHFRYEHVYPVWSFRFNDLLED